MTGEAHRRPALHIVRGTPTDEELAAVTAVLLAVARGRTATEPAAGQVGWTPVRDYSPPGTWTSR
jgi:hypothetical protein